MPWNLMSKALGVIVQTVPAQSPDTLMSQPAVDKLAAHRSQNTEGGRTHYQVSDWNRRLFIRRPEETPFGPYSDGVLVAA